jgi:hypothetical protein
MPLVHTKHVVQHSRDAGRRWSSRRTVMRAMPPTGIRAPGPTPPAAGGNALRRLRLLSVLAAIATACERSPRAAEYAGVPIVISDSLLRFPSGAEYVSGFRNVEYIGSIGAQEKSPFIIIAGHECGECDAPPSVLLRSPSDGPVRDFTGLPGWHPYPGRVIAYSEDSTIVSFSRLFWGRCLPERPPGLIEYRTEYVRDGGEPQRDVLITEIENDSLLEWRRVATTRLLATTLVQVQARECAEVPPRDIPAPP